MGFCSKWELMKTGGVSWPINNSIYRPMLLRWARLTHISRPLTPVWPQKGTNNKSPDWLYRVLYKYTIVLLCRIWTEVVLIQFQWDISIPILKKSRTNARYVPLSRVCHLAVSVCRYIISLDQCLRRLTGHEHDLYTVVIHWEHSLLWKVWLKRNNDLIWFNTGQFLKDCFCILSNVSKIP